VIEKHLQDRIYWGLNRAASVLGRQTDAYRPKGKSEPLARSNRYLKLAAAFGAADGRFDKAIGFGQTTWCGYFDGSYTRVGDYLVQNNDVWFIVAQQSLLPVLCVKANNRLSIERPVAPSTGASYGTGTTGATVTVLTNWPASLLAADRGMKPPSQLPADVRAPGWVGILPSSHGQTLQAADIVTGDHGLQGIVLSAELSDLGWRLNIGQLTT